MKRIILICGLIAGLIASSTMVYSMILCYRSNKFEGNMLLGYASMLIAFSMIFVGIRSYRNKYNQGVISFGKAFRIGLFIALVASSIYVTVWLIDYYVFIPDFMDKYTTHILNQAKSSGATEAEMATKTKEMAMYTDMYKNPLFVILLTYAEILPVGLIVSLISALILKRKSTTSQAVTD